MAKDGLHLSSSSVITHFTMAQLQHCEWNATIFYELRECLNTRISQAGDILQRDARQSRYTSIPDIGKLLNQRSRLIGFHGQVANSEQLHSSHEITQQTSQVRVDPRIAAKIQSVSTYIKKQPVNLVITDTVLFAIG